MRFDNLYLVAGSRKERRAQIAAMGKQGRQFRERAFRHNAIKALVAKETL